MATTSKEELKVKELLQKPDIRTMKKDLAKLREAESLQNGKKTHDTMSPKKVGPEPMERVSIRFSPQKETLPEVKEKELGQVESLKDTNLVQDIDTSIGKNSWIQENKSIPAPQPPKNLEKKEFYYPSEDAFKEMPLKEEKGVSNDETKSKKDTNKNTTQNTPPPKLQPSNLGNSTTITDDQKDKTPASQKNFNKKSAEFTAERKYQTEPRMTERREPENSTPKETFVPKRESNIYEAKNNQQSWLESKETQNQIKPNETPEREYLKEVPEATKNTLATMAKTEKVKRTKFIEDVEKWALSSSKGTEDREIK